MSDIDYNAIRALHRQIDDERDKITALFGPQWGARVERVRPHLLWNGTVLHEVRFIELLLVNQQPDVAEERWLRLRDAVDGWEKERVETMLADAFPDAAPVTEPVIEPEHVTIPVTEERVIEAFANAEAMVDDTETRHDYLVRQFVAAGSPRWLARILARLI